MAIGKTNQEALLEQITRDTTDMLGRRCGTVILAPGTQYTGRLFAVMGTTPGACGIDLANTITGIQLMPNTGVYTVPSGVPLYGDFASFKSFTGWFLGFIECENGVGL